MLNKALRLPNLPQRENMLKSHTEESIAIDISKEWKYNGNDKELQDFSWDFFSSNITRTTLRIEATRLSVYAKCFLSSGARTP